MKYKKKELLKITDSMIRANQMIREGLVQNQKDAEIMLAECQSAAMEIGTDLEAQGKYTASVISKLEEYCEEIYQQSIHLDNPEICRKISKTIEKQLVGIANDIKFELPEDKKEVVFLPYKASMWDSLESIWMAARDDEECDAYVIPIPYFEKNPDGSFGQMHYEGELYPDEVPVTDWQIYSISEHKPDVIYIHNPYDEYNYVSSVHPMFYAKELKKYTNLLVYVPYFIGIDNHVEEHFCTTPGVMYSDRVVVETKEVKNIYIKQLRKLEKKIGRKGAFGNLEEKILALGSPKLDRVRKIKRDNLNLPEQWEHLIRKADGTQKKIVLYNTTVDSLLRFNENAIKKIESTLRIFKEHPEIVLLWRPHPLIMSTLRSMRTDLYMKYCRIVEEYQKEKWGIYDDTADLNRAIALSDAYYGDWSSVVTLYQATGKSIMIQNYEIGIED